MKKNQIYFILSLILLIPASLSFIACSDEDKEEGMEAEITVSDLPAKSQTFLTTYFYGYSATKVVMDTENGVTVYEVDLTDGYEVVFNYKGDWVQVSAPEGKSIPSGIVPEVIQEYLDANYSGYGVNEINYTGNGYNVELNNMQGGSSIEISFSESGTVTDTSQD